MKKIAIFISMFLLSTLLISCRDAALPSDEIKGRVLIWHPWEGRERDALLIQLNNFMELNPDIVLVEERVPPDEIVEKYIEQAHSGYGPDIVIAPADLSLELAHQGIIHHLDAQEIDTEIYLHSVLDTLKDEEILYGVPLTVNTFGLYYNKALLGDLAPATHLDDLLQHADLGHLVALPMDFYGAAWGIHPFGGQIIDEEDRVVLNQGGFANWLGWLKQASSNPNIILNRRQNVLQSLFTSGQATYYVGGSQELPHLQDVLGDETVGVVRLPGRPDRPASPFLEVDTIYFNRAISDESLTAGLHLADYLTHVEQQQELALSAEWLPVNKHVQIDSRLSPIMAELIAQSHTSISIDVNHIDEMHDIIAMGDTLYPLVMDGEVSINDAATDLTTQINAQYGVETLVAEFVNCDVTGAITLQHTWAGEAEAALAEIADEFGNNCPGASIILEQVEPINLYNRYVDANNQSERPTMIIGQNRWLLDFVEAGTIQNIDRLLDDDFTQRYLPAVEQSAMVENNLYGVPVGMDSFALYFNNSLAQDPPLIIDDLQTMVTEQAQLGIPIDFYESYWGISAFGESSDNHLFDENGRLIIGERGLAEWLAWLKEMDAQPYILLSTDTEQLYDMFAAEELAFLAGESSQLGRFRHELGDNKVNIVPLPASAPFLLVDSFMIDTQATEAQQELALAFAHFATGIESQETLLNLAHKAPINVNVTVDNSTGIAGLMEQIQTAVPIPNIPATQAVFEWGDFVYEQVLQNDIAPADAINEFTNTVEINQENDD